MVEMVIQWLPDIFRTCTNSFPSSTSKVHVRVYCAELVSVGRKYVDAASLATSMLWRYGDHLTMHGIVNRGLLHLASSTFSSPQSSNVAP